MTWHWGAFVIGFLTWPALSIVAIALLLWLLHRQGQPPRQPRSRKLPETLLGIPVVEVDEAELLQPRFRTLEEVERDNAATGGPLERRAIDRLLREVGGR